MVNKRTSWEDKQWLTNVIAQSSSRADLLKAAGLTATSGNYATLSRWLKRHEIEPVFTIKKKTQRYGHKRNVSEILCKNSLATRRTVITVLKRDNLLPYCCEKCGNPGEWCGRPIVLQLEHKNGVSDDNRLENLAWLCPNCHSQTPTYAGKNKRQVDVAEQNNTNMPRLAGLSIEQRRADLAEVDLQQIGADRVLANKWGIKPQAVRQWLAGEGITLPDTYGDVRRVFRPLSDSQKELRLKTLSFIKATNIGWLSELAQAWGVAPPTAKRWLIKHAPNWYATAYVRSSKLT